MRIFILLLLIISFISGCKQEKQRKDETGLSEAFSKISSIKRDLEDIKADGKLTAVTTYSSTSYFLYRGQPMGFEYELLKRFAEYLDVELEIRISNSIDSLFRELQNEEVDLIAHGLTITSGRKQIVDFTDYLYLTHQVLVQKKPDNWRKMSWSSVQSHLVHDAIELIGDTVSVRANSSYIQRLDNLSHEIGGKIHIDTLPGNLSTSEIIKMVVDGKIKYTIADNNLASINASYYPILNIDVPVSFSQRIGWAVRPQADELLVSANQWLKKIKKKVDYYVIYNKYFKNKRDFRKRIQSEFYSLNENKISKYDDLIKKHASKINWDWRLLASLVYQESRYNPTASSWAGAQGLMQIMPATASDLGVTNRSDPKQSVEGGTKYLDQLYERFDKIEDSLQRIKFTIASYNCGYYHVKDARKLAEMKDLDPNRWDENVAEMILELSYPANYNLPEIKYGYVRGIEPYTYVDQIFKRFDHYKKFIET
ncbi:MAG: transporter substrate-binding domain-containing protein [Bacteroidales bacterium]|nr:transporter substrate-binding domain-containing protein [Bacteroidales bacterium]